MDSLAGSTSPSPRTHRKSYGASRRNGSLLGCGKGRLIDEQRVAVQERRAGDLAQRRRRRYLRPNDSRLRLVGKRARGGRD